LSKKEQVVMKDDVYKPIQKIGTDITGVFATLPLENASGQLLTDAGKKALIGKGNIILDFWASWCVPCRARMEEIKSDKVTINKKRYQIIYLSIDANDQMWNSAPYPFLNKWNSFRITSPHNQFIKDFSIAVFQEPYYCLKAH
jgi:thiol-disulfide isomerase/thioredoxin